MSDGLSIWRSWTIPEVTTESEGQATTAASSSSRAEYHLFQFFGISIGNLLEPQSIKKGWPLHVRRQRFPCLLRWLGLSRRQRKERDMSEFERVQRATITVIRRPGVYPAGKLDFKDVLIMEDDLLIHLGRLVRDLNSEDGVQAKLTIV